MIYCVSSFVCFTTLVTHYPVSDMAHRGRDIGPHTRLLSENSKRKHATEPEVTVTVAKTSRTWQ